MEAAVNFYLREGLAKSTRKAYNTGQQRYLRFCQLIDLQPVPASEHQLMLFSAYLAMQGLKWQTNLSAVCHLHLMGAPQGGFSDLAQPRLQLLLRGIRRSTSAIPKRTRLPITPLILQQVWQACPAPATDHNAMMMWTAMATCFFGFLWAGKVCCPSASDYDPTWHLCVSDLALDNHSAPTRLYITIKASKTDPFAKR